MFENKKLRSIFTAGGDGPMFENKRSKSIFTAEAVLPLVVSVLGGIAPYFYSSAGKYFAQGLEEACRRAAAVLKWCACSEQAHRDLMRASGK